MPDNKNNNASKGGGGTPSDETLAKYIAFGLIGTRIEGGYGSISESSDGSGALSIGCSQWEQGRAENLLRSIPGGDKFIGQSYASVDKGALEKLLDSPEGQKAQQNLLSSDCLAYVQACKEAGITDPKTIIYVGMWCPTSTGCATSNAAKHGGNQLISTNQYFHDSYYVDAGVGSQFQDGYANRATTTFNYVNGLNDVSKDPDPSLIIKASDASSGNGGAASRSSDKGFKFIPHGDFVDVIKLPENRTYCEPIYPDYITVSDTVPKWVLDTGSATKDEPKKRDSFTTSTQAIGSDASSYERVTVPASN